MSRMVIEITATEGGARMVNTSTWESAEAMQQILDMGVIDGSSSAIGRLDALLAA